MGDTDEKSHAADDNVPYVLYVRDGDSASERALDIAQTMSYLFDVVDASAIPIDKRPEWLKGTPSLVEKATRKLYAGSNALSKLNFSIQEEVTRLSAPVVDVPVVAPAAPVAPISSVAQTPPVNVPAPVSPSAARVTPTGFPPPDIAVGGGRLAVPQINQGSATGAAATEWPSEENKRNDNAQASQDPGQQLAKERERSEQQAAHIAKLEMIVNQLQQQTQTQTFTAAPIENEVHSLTGATPQVQQSQQPQQAHQVAMPPPNVAVEMMAQMPVRDV
jgi:hypothetical protein